MAHAPAVGLPASTNAEAISGGTAVACDADPLKRWQDEDVGEHDASVVRARGYRCCRTTDETDVEHLIWHCTPADLPRWWDGELYVMTTPLRASRGDWSADFDDEEEHWFVVHGVVERRQPGPSGGWDVFVRRTDGIGIALYAYDDEAIGADFDARVREFTIIRDRNPTRSTGGTIARVERPDPLFRLRHFSQLWFDARWPLPDGSKPLRTITGSKSSAGWTDMAAGHDCLDHVNAIGSPGALVGALSDTVKHHERWGGVVIARGGGGTPGAGGDWLAPLNDSEVVEAVRRVQDTGLPILAAIGHEADDCAVDAVADFSWATPSLLGQTLADWRSYLVAELASPPDAMTMATYSLGRSVRQAFDEAWLRTRQSHESAKYVFPERTWHAT